MSEPRTPPYPEADDADIEAILATLSDDDFALENPPDSIWRGIEEAAFGPPIAPVVELPQRRTTPLLIAAAAAVALVVAIGGAVLVSGGSDDVDYVVLGTADMAWQEGFDVAGTDAAASASLLEGDDALYVRLDDAALPDPEVDADLELWLIGVDGGEIEAIQSLGLVADASDPGVFAVPAEFGTAGFDTVQVDISIEPRDGDATHSGRSIVRGPLDA